jgi:hypothetical protein
MKESEFIELLNLYVDHEISPADAERLEAEVMAVPERRRVYHEYCLMHKACSLLAGHFQDQAAQVHRIRSRSPQRFFGQPAVYAGLFAAACAAFLLVVRIRTAPVAPSPSSVASAAARPDNAPALASAPAGDDLQPVFGIRTLSLKQDGIAAAEMPDQFAWIKGVQFVPLTAAQINPLVLKGAPSLPEPEARLVTDSADSPAPVETISFKFQR